MFRITTIASAVLALATHGAQAQETQKLERIEITGSSIKRVDAETALPVTVIKRSDIERSGFTTASDLIQSLPSMQGFVTASKSVNGGGGGATTASLHALGSAYTLVLLNGRRLAPFNTGTTVNLNSIPLSMVERIEVLTDGASALYGADAIAGVVNFILRKDGSDGTVNFNANLPQKAGGKSASFSIAKGFGDLERDRFNVQVGFSAEKQDELNADQRDFSKTGFIPFTHNGQQVTTWFSSSNTIPGAVILTDKTGNGDGDAFYSPYYLKTGKCGERSVYRAGVCRFDFSSTVQNIADYRRDSLFASGRLKLAESATLFAELGLSDYRTNPRYAPPAQQGIYLTQALVDKHVTPYLAKLGIPAGSFFPVGDPAFNGPNMNLRVYDAGGRTDEYRTKTQHIVVGAEGSFGEIDYTVSYTHSQNKFTDSLKAGYLSSNAFNKLVAEGKFDPLDALIGQSVDALAPAVLHQLFDASKSSLDVLNVRGSMPLFKLAGGDAAVGFGGDAGMQKYADSPSAIAMGKNALQPDYTDAPIGGSSGALPFDAKRNSYGAFVELGMPVIQGLELNGAARYDKYDAVRNRQNFDPAGRPLAAATQGKSADAVTYKLSARYQPIQEVLLRGSYGTGFKAPTLANITNPVQAAGSTGFHECPPGLPADVAAACFKVPAEYNLRTGGNPSSGQDGLSAEKSRQWTLGFRVEPSRDFTFGADLWQVQLKNRIATVPEEVAFSDGVTYRALFSVLPDPVTGKPTLTYDQKPSNLGRARYRGVDLDTGGSLQTPLGKLTARGTLTYMLKADYEVPGLSGYQTSMARIGPDNEVTFRWLSNLSFTLDSGPLSNTLNVQLKPGYHDDETSEIRVIKADGSIGDKTRVSRDVASYTLVDWQGKYQFDKAMSLTLGVKNLFNTKPPFTVQNRDGTGNMRGYDARYADALLRQYYVAGQYRF